MSSPSVNSSTTTLVTAAPKQNRRSSSHFPEKNYALALASLQSSYGASGHAPVLPPRDSFPQVLKASEMPKSTGTSRQSRWKGLLFHSVKWTKTRRGSSDVVECGERDTSSPELDVEISAAHDRGDRTRASGAEPERTSPSSSSSDQKKDFTTAFANLQSSYGIGAPVVAGTSH